MESLPLPLLVVLIVVAVVVGLWVGSRSQRSAGASGKPGAKETKPWGARLRDAAGKGAVSVFQWNRARKKRAKQAAKEREQD